MISQLPKRIQLYFPHFIVLAFIIAMPLLTVDQDNIRGRVWFNRYYFQLFFYCIAFYLNYLVLVPHLFDKSKRKLYFLASALSILLILFISQSLVEWLMTNNFLRNKEVPQLLNPKQLSHSYWRSTHIFTYAISLVLIFGFGTGMRVIQQLRKKESLEKELEKTRVETELAFLKNQINPHFFFNTLNNIYALIVIDTEKAQKAVEKLSGLMRYLIYESDVSKVKLQKELDFTRNYIDLMKQRLSAKVKLDLDIQEYAPDIDIPPLIFISFIENAFKHGVSYRENSFIDISLKTREDEILFICRNSVPKKENAGEETLGGVGYANVKKRLDILYDKQYNLEHKIEDGTYEIKLRIPLEQITTVMSRQPKI